MTTPTPSIPPDLARALRLSQAPSAKHIGYWREAEIYEEHTGQYGYRLRSAQEDLRKLEATGSCGYTTSAAAPFGGDMRKYLEHEIERLPRLRDLWASLPWPGDHLDPAMPEAERERVAALLDRWPITTGYMGYSFDRLNREYSPGTGERAACGWVWPEGLSHYVRRYGLVLPEDFLAAIGGAR